MKTTPQKRFQELDALRGIAALMVVFFHFTMGKEQGKLGFNLGVTGVDLFFMISGFVIFMSLNRIKKSSDFIINRFSRLYPTYWACVTITFLARLSVAVLVKKEVIEPAFYMRYLANLTMFQSYLGFEDIDPPYWTMIIEMTFYIGILLLFIIKGLRFLTGLGIILIVIGLCGCYFPKVFPIGFVFRLFPILTFVPLFLAGTVFYKIYTYRKELWLNHIVIAFCLGSQMAFFEFGGTSRSYITANQYALMLVVYFVLFLLFVNDKLQFIISKPTLFFGKISFALYLIHQFIGIGIIIPFFRTRLHANFWMGVFVALIVVVTLAYLITSYVEIPYSKKMKQQLYAWRNSKYSES